MIIIIGIMIGFYILMRAVVVVQKLMNPDSLPRKILEAGSILFAIAAFAVSIWGMQALWHLSSDSAAPKIDETPGQFT